MVDRDDVDGRDGGAGEVRREPPHRHARRQIERHVEARGARIVGQRRHFERAGGVLLDVQSAQRVIEVEADMLRVAKAVLALERVGDLAGNLLRRDDAACPRHDHFGEPARVDADELVRADRLDHALGRDRALGAEIGRAEDRDVGDDAGVLDDVADAHDVAGDGDVGAQRRLVAVRRRGRVGEAGGEREGEGKEAIAERMILKRIMARAFLTSTAARSSAASRRPR